jgi:thioredoxin-related protein
MFVLSISIYAFSNNLFFVNKSKDNNVQKVANSQSNDNEQNSDETVESSSDTPEEVEWLTFTEGIERIKNENKPAVVDFYASWCYYCRLMDQNTFTNSEVKRLLHEEFIPIRLNTEDNTTEFEYQENIFTPATFSLAAGVTGLPSIMFLDKDANKIVVVPGYLAPDVFVPLLTFMKKECYTQELTLQQYIDNGHECE